MARNGLMTKKQLAEFAAMTPEEQTEFASEGAPMAQMMVDEIERLRTALRLLASDGSDMGGAAWRFAASTPGDALRLRREYAREVLAQQAAQP